MNADMDLYAAAERALGKTRALFEGRAIFTSAKRLLADGSWQGPAQAACRLVAEAALGPLGGLEAAKMAGADTVLLSAGSSLVAQAHSLGLRVLVEAPFAFGEPASERQSRLAALEKTCHDHPAVDGVVPTPSGEAQGLDTLMFFAACRQACSPQHVIADVERFGHKLGQLCLSFGADELMGSISAQRALRLGERASSNDLTRDEAALLLRSSGFVPCERLPEGKVQPL